MSEIPRGAIRFNTDSNRVEVWNGSVWGEMQLSTPNLGRSVDTEPGARAVFGGGIAPTDTSRIDYINISSTGDAVIFGDLTEARAAVASVSSRTRGIYAGGLDTPSPVETQIQFITLSSTGDAANFGDLTVSTSSTDHMSSACNSTRGIFAGGGDTGPETADIQFITMASTGNSVDFGGNLTQARMMAGSGRSNSIIGVFSGGITPGNTNVMDFVTIATSGAAQDFGDVSRTGVFGMGQGNASNTIRAILGGGSDGTASDQIEYFEFAKKGNTVNFGDLTEARRGSGATSNCIRAVFAGGRTPGESAVIDYIQIMSEGNAVDFGDLSEARSFSPAGCSNAHGGL